MPNLTDEHRAQLAAALAHVPETALSAHDTKILNWLAGWDDDVVDGVCSLLRLAAVHAEQGAPAPQGGEPASVREAYRPHRTPNGGER